MPLAVAAILAAAVLGLSARQSNATTDAGMQMAAGGQITQSQLVFRNRMRVLWEQHVAWTRMAIVSFDGKLPDLTATEHRLLRNQRDIGGAIAPFYGAAAGHDLTVLL